MPSKVRTENQRPVIFKISHEQYALLKKLYPKRGELSVALRDQVKLLTKKINPRTKA